MYPRHLDEEPPPKHFRAQDDHTAAAVARIHPPDDMNDVMRRAPCFPAAP